MHLIHVGISAESLIFAVQAYNPFRFVGEMLHGIQVFKTLDMPPHFIDCFVVALVAFVEFYSLKDAVQQNDNNQL
jgi:hypothetical protein